MKKLLKYLAPSFITLVILLILFYLQGLYPFSDNSIVQVDADYQFIPVLYRIYDFLHGNANIIYDDIGLGNSIYTSMVIQGSIFSPLSLLLYFTSRDNIVNYFNILVIVKFCLLSLTTYIYINKSYKIREYYKVIFSVLYTFSGWVILNYFNIMWLDCVILFPLIVMYLDKLLKENKYMGYVITLSLSLIISYYISYFILLFVLFYSFIYIFLKVDKDKVKKTIVILGISTGISFLISAFSTFPSVYQTLISSRLDNTSYEVSLFNNFMNKSLFLMFCPVFIVVFLCLIFNFKKDKKNIYMYILLFILFGIGLFIEPINVGVHLGSYWSFPYRYSFITIFVMMMGSMFYIGKYDFKGFSSYTIIRVIIYIFSVITLVLVYNLYKDSIVDSLIVLDFDDYSIYLKIVLISVLVLLVIVLSFTFNGKLRYILFSISCLLEIFIFCSFSMYYGDGYYLSKNSNDINNNLSIVRNDLFRYKMGYSDYSPDYGFIYGVNTLDNWLHILPSNEIDIYNRLGYGNMDTCVRSYGGTIFTDWLFNVRYLISKAIVLNDKMYSVVDSYNGYYLYEYNYLSSFGLVYNKVDDVNNIDDGFILQNNIYRNLFNKDNDLIKIDDYELRDEFKLDYEINELGFVYLKLDDKVDYIKVNGKYFSVVDDFYIIDLGMYDDDISINIVDNELDYISFSVGYIKYSDILNMEGNVKNVNKVKYGYDINVYNEYDNGYLFLPINNISGLNAYVNDKKVKIDSYLDNFVSIKLDNGNNKIEIRYELPLFKIGIVLSIVGLICLLLFRYLKYNKYILNVGYYVYIVVCGLFFVYYYVYCLFKYYG